MVIKYRARAATVYSGVMWLVFASIQMFLLFTSRNLDYHLFFLFLIFLGLILGLFLSFAYFTIQNIDYIRLEKSFLSIHRGFPIPRKKIILSNLEKGNILDDRIVLILKDEEQVELNSRDISVDDFEKLKKELRKHINIE